MKAINSGKCAITNLGDNFWNWLAAIYYAAKEFGQEVEIENAIKEYYPYICTCKAEIDSIAATIGATAVTSQINSACSE